MTYYITTPIYYVNDKPHIGHAYTSIICDAIARARRALGDDVHFVTGTDEHGQKVAESAQACGQDTQEFVDRNAQLFASLAQVLGLTHDDFIRTTEQRHILGAQALWRLIANKGHIYLSHYEGWYAKRDEAFYKQDELVPGPAGKLFAPSGAPVEWITEPSFFFRLSSFAERLLEHYQNSPEFILPEERRREVVRFVESGLTDLSISRTSYRWGIPVPDASAVDQHVMYVWFDALTNYLSVLGYPWSPNNNSDASKQKFWPANVHVVGKDILRFHAVYWPAMLMAAELPLPKQILAHGWWTNNGQKISKSLGNVIDPLALIDDYGLDQVRYFLFKEVRLGSDGDYSRERLLIRANVDLADDLGNLCQRVLTLLSRHFAGVLPAPVASTEAEETMSQLRTDISARAIQAYRDNGIQQALRDIWELVREANRYIDAQAPWKYKDSLPRMGTILYTLANVIRDLAVLLAPVIPDACRTICVQLGQPESTLTTFASVDVPLVAGSVLPKPEPIFRKQMPNEENSKNQS